MDFAFRRTLFGPKPQVPSISAFGGKPQQLLTEMPEFLAKCHSVFASHKRAREEHSRPYLGRTSKLIKQKLSEVEKESRPFVQTILKHRAMWLRVESQTDIGRKEYESFWQHFRVGSQLLVAVDKVPKSRPGPVFAKIQKIVPEVNACTWACRTVFKQMMSLSLLSLRWADYLKTLISRRLGIYLHPCAI